jgi:hypothetical protein
VCGRFEPEVGAELDAAGAELPAVEDPDDVEGEEVVPGEFAPLPLPLPPLPEGCVELVEASTTTVPFMNGWIVQK